METYQFQISVHEYNCNITITKSMRISIGINSHNLFNTNTLFINSVYFCHFWAPQPQYHAFLFYQYANHTKRPLKVLHKCHPLANLLFTLLLRNFQFLFLGIKLKYLIFIIITIKNPVKHSTGRYNRFLKLSSRKEATFLYHSSVYITKCLNQMSHKKEIWIEHYRISCILGLEHKTIILTVVHWDWCSMELDRDVKM